MRVILKNETWKFYSNLTKALDTMRRIWIRFAVDVYGYTGTGNFCGLIIIVSTYIRRLALLPNIWCMCVLIIIVSAC